MKTIIGILKSRTPVTDTYMIKAVVLWKERGLINLYPYVYNKNVWELIKEVEVEI